MNRLMRALACFRPDMARILFALVLMIASTSLSLLKPWPLALIVDCLLADKPLPPILAPFADWSKPALLGMLGGAILALHVTQGVISAWHNYVSIQAGLRGLARVRNDVFQWLQRLALRFYHQVNQGDVIHRASWDTYAFQTFFQQGLFTSVQALLSLVLMLAIMWRVNGRLTWWSVATLPLLLFTMKTFGAPMRRRSLEAHQVDSQVTSLIQQTIVALPVIQSYTREPEEQERFSREVNRSFDKRLSQHGWEVLYWFAVAVVFGLGAAGMTWLGANEVLSQRLTVGEMLIFLAYLAQLYEPLNQLSHVGATLTDASAGIQRVFELLDTPEDVKEIPKPRPICSAANVAGTLSSAVREPIDPGLPIGSTTPLIVRGEVRFDGVSFGYREDRPVLRDISIAVPAGESVAIVGPSGSGKTTLLQLLPRFYDPTHGSVRLDGVDLRELRLRDLRAQISLVFQEAILLRGSAAENIAYGKPSASQSEIEAAARAAHADEFIRKLPNGYATEVGEGGARLSVGEKQRLNLARAFLKDSPILALDEPTSALDAESEALVVASLGELLRHRTALVVAHRLSTIRRVHKIVVIEAGRITEMGTHEELMRQKGYYARMARLNCD